MSFSAGSGAQISVGTLSASFVLNAAAGQSAINNILGGTNQIRDAFKNTYKLNLDNSTAVKNVSQVDNSIKNAFKTVYQLKVDNRQAIQAIDQTTKASNGLKQALEFGGALIGIGLIGKTFSTLGDSIIGMNAKLQQSAVAFTVLTGSAQTSATLVGQLETLASHSTFGLGQLQSGAQALLAYGVAAGNVPPLLQAIQNAAALAGGDTAEVFQRVSTVVGELASGLPVTERQIRQLAQAGVNIPQLAQQLGLTSEQLYNVGKTGVVTGGQVAAAFIQMYGEGGKFGNAMAAQANTFSGAMNIIKTNLSLAIAQGFQPLFQWISTVAVKIGQFVQTSTFQSWVASFRSGIGEAITVLQTFASILEPIGSALAKVFGLKTGDISAEMAAVKDATVDVGKYDASLQGAGATTDDTKAKLAEYKKTIDDAALAIAGFNEQLATNKVALDSNAAAIQSVKNQYDPIIKSATQKIHDINVLTPDELSRKQRELELDRDKANLELTRPDTSLFDTQILSDQTTLANMPRLDTSSWDNKIASLDQQIQSAQDEDPTAGLRSQIQTLQDEIGGLNTDEFDRKINGIREQLAEPAPDTHGITNQLVELQAQLAGGQISQSQFDTQYGALSRQKQGINQAYEDKTTGLSGQLKLLESQRATQAEANAETRQADENRIRDLERQAAVKQKEHDDDLKSLQRQRTEQEHDRSAAEAADAKRRQALEDDIRTETNLRAQALAPYEAAMKRITDAQAQNSLKDAAAAAQRAIDLAPYQAALDDAKGKEQALLEPLDQEKQRLDDIRTKLTEQKTEQENARTSAEANAKAIKDGADNAGLLATNMGKVASSIPDDSRWGAFKDSAAGEDSPFVSFLKLVNTNLQSLKAIIDNDVVPAVTRFGDWLKGDGLNGVKELWRWLDSNFTPALRDLWKVLSTDLPPVLGDLSRIVGTVLVFDFKSWKTAIDDLVAPTLRLLIEVMSGQLHNELTALHNILDGDVFNSIGKVTGAFNDFVLKMQGDGGVMGTLADLLAWVEGNWGSIGTALTTPFTTAWGGIKTFFGDLHSGLNWLADHFKLPAVGSLPWETGGGVGSLPPASGGDNAVRGYAGGVVNSPHPGHWAIVGEKGPEPMWVPSGATIVPNHVAGAMGMLPGHADGFNLENVFGALGGVVAGSAGRFADALMGGLPAIDIPGVPGAAAALTKQIGEGVARWLATSPLNAIRRALTGGINLPGMHGGAFEGYADLIEKYAAQYGVPDDIIGAIILHESGGIVGRIEDGGGLGRGLMQMDIGQNPRYNSPLLIDTTRAGADYQIRTGTELLAGMLAAAGGDIEAALTSYTGAGFAAVNNGQDFYQVLMNQGFDANARAMLDAYLGGQSAPTGGGDGFPSVLAAAGARLGETFHDGHAWDYWCEQFVETVDRDAGYSLSNYDSAWAHGSSLSLSGGTPPAGASAFWSPGGGWSSYGHTAISVGDGTFITTSPQGIVQAGNGWLDSDHYAGWAPPGLADGGYFPGNAGRVVEIGEGRHDEIASPVPLMRQIVREESGGGDFSFVFHEGAIAVARDGNVTVNRDRVDILGAYRGQGGRG